jgi:hypothetical protein
MRSSAEFFSVRRRFNEATFQSSPKTSVRTRGTAGDVKLRSQPVRLTGTYSSSSSSSSSSPALYTIIYDILCYEHLPSSRQIFSH